MKEFVGKNRRPMSHFLRPEMENDLLKNEVPRPKFVHSSRKRRTSFPGAKSGATGSPRWRGVGTGGPRRVSQRPMTWRDGGAVTVSEEELVDRL